MLACIVVWYVWILFVHVSRCTVCCSMAMMSGHGHSAFGYSESFCSFVCVKLFRCCMIMTYCLMIRLTDHRYVTKQSLYCFWVILGAINGKTFNWSCNNHMISWCLCQIVFRVWSMRHILWTHSFACASACSFGRFHNVSRPHDASSRYCDCAAWLITDISFLVSDHDRVLILRMTSLYQLIWSLSINILKRSPRHANVHNKNTMIHTIRVMLIQAIWRQIFMWVL